MRARRAVVPTSEALVDELSDVVPSDEPTVHGSDATEDLDDHRVCLSCGSINSAHQVCTHREVARFYETSRKVRDAVARLRNAVAEQRAAERAMRALVTSEATRGRAEFEPLPPTISVSAPCTRCAARATAELTALEQAVTTATRKTHKKPRISDAQCVITFAAELPTVWSFAPPKG